MEKFKLNIEYKAGNTVYKTNLFETPDFKINYKASTQRIRLDLKAKVPIEILNLTVTVPYAFDVDDRVFPNGYQSWTDCREMFVNEVPQHTVLPTTLVFRHTLLGASGSYNFTENIKKPGVFTAFSYLYVRNGSEYDLFASLSERNGYTIIRTDCEKGEINIIKDLEGVVYNGEYNIFDVVHLTGEEDEVFDKWFALMNIDKPTAKVKNGYTTWYNYR